MGRQTQTRERLVRTAGELFWTQGYAQTGVSSIMKHARATSGSFYHFFPTKDDLLLAVLDAVDHHLEKEILQPAEEASDDAAQRVTNLAESYRTYAASEPSRFGIPVGALACELGAGHEPALRRLDEICGRFASRIAEWFTGCDVRVDHVELAGFIVASLEGAAVMAKTRRSVGYLDACALQLEIHLKAVSGTAPRHGEGPPMPSTLGGEAGDWKAW